MKKIHAINLILAFVTFGCSSEPKQEIQTTQESAPVATVAGADTILNLFNTVFIQNGKVIKLGSDIETLNGIVSDVAPNNYVLNKGSYMVADSMAVETNANNQIVGITAAYYYDTAYVHEKRKYQKLLSDQGKEYTFKSTSQTFRVTKWQNEAIAFELIEAIAGNNKQIYSVIFDKALYLEKLKPEVDLSNKNTSLELYRRVKYISS